MDKPKTPVMKSKSSNSTSETKKNIKKNNKKTRRNADCQSKTTIRSEGVLQRRSVYVEKKIIPMNDINNRDQSPEALPNKLQTSLPRAIPRPDRKRFLASVLSILSQATTGTQFPDIADGLRKIDKAKAKPKRRKSKEKDHQEDSIISSNSKRKPKYRSRILNNCADSEHDQLIVLKSTNKITHSSSNNFECARGKESASNTIYREAVEKGPSNQNNLDVTAPKATTSKREIQAQPLTIFTDIPKKDEKTFYNFFVDILKTTFSVYNVKTEFNEQLPTTAKPSNSDINMAGHVRGKLKAQNIKQRNSNQKFSIQQKPSPNHLHNIVTKKRHQLDERQLQEQLQAKFSQRSRLPVRRQNFKPNSFTYEKVRPFPKTNSLPMPSKKKTLKKNPKADFIKLLKSQLQQDDCYEEPENFYQALKVISRNKRRSQKFTHFGSSQPSDADDHVCQFKRRRVLSAKSNDKQSKNYHETHFDPHNHNYTFKKRTAMNNADKYDVKKDISTFSLKVIGYDYEPIENRVNDDFYHCPPTPPTAIEDYNDSLFMGHMESGTSVLMVRQ